MKEKDITSDRLKDLADRSFSNNKYTYSSFLSEGELSDYFTIERELKYASPILWGGSENSDRVMVRFGDPESLGYEEDFPIVLLEIRPLNSKFSDDFSQNS